MQFCYYCHLWNVLCWHYFAHICKASKYDMIELHYSVQFLNDENRCAQCTVYNCTHTVGIAFGCNLNLSINYVISFEWMFALCYAASVCVCTRLYRRVMKLYNDDIQQTLARWKMPFRFLNSHKLHSKWNFIFMSVK